MNFYTSSRSAYFASIVTAAASALILSGCSENTEASLEVIKEKAEAKLVKVAGEGEVALKLSQKQYAELKEKLVRIKTQKANSERLVEEAKANADRLRKEGKADQAALNDRRVEMYARNLKFLTEREPLAEAKLREHSALIEQMKEELRMTKEEIAMYTASGSLNEDLSVTSKSDQRMETIKDLMAKMREKGERAKALFEVSELEQTLK